MVCFNKDGSKSLGVTGGTNMSWLKDVIGTEKAVIAMCHLMPMPGDPGFKNGSDHMDQVITWARKDLLALQEGGVDAVMFSNEFSLPYLTDVETVTVACMARIIGELNSVRRQCPLGCEEVAGSCSCDGGKICKRNFHRRLRQRFRNLGYQRRPDNPSPAQNRGGGCQASV